MKTKMQFEVYRDNNMEFRWRLRARNGKILADSGEGYKKKAAVLKIIAKIMTAMQQDYPIEEMID